MTATETVLKLQEKAKPKVERIHVLKAYQVDSATLLLPQQELGVIENPNAGGWIDFEVMAVTRKYAAFLRLLGVVA